MPKIAFFVEGQTELIFLKHFISYVGRANNVYFGKNEGSKKLAVLRGHSPYNQREYFVQINDCKGGGVDCVLSDMVDSYDSLVKNGFHSVIGLRDTYPHFERNRYNAIQQKMNDEIPQGRVEGSIILAKMETEAWFLAEYTHLAKINAVLTVAFVKKHRGYDIKSANMEFLDKPCDELKEIYKLGGAGYDKSWRNVTRTVRCLDFSRMTQVLPLKYEAFKLLAAKIEEFVQ